jgi:integrase
MRVEKLCGIHPVTTRVAGAGFRPPRFGVPPPEAETDDGWLPCLHVHDLRHTHATHLPMDGWDVARVARRLGHANPAIILKRCAHAITETQGDNAVTPAGLRIHRHGVRVRVREL